MNDNNSILSPVMLWENFNAELPLKEIKTGEVDYEGVIYNEVYFSGREVADGRVRIFGVYAKQKNVTKKQPKGAIIILPDYTETVNYEIINLYVKQGYAVLMIDYRGEFAGCENHTNYPESIAYANYIHAERKLDYADTSAKETCWYEWTAVARYAVSYLKNQKDIENIGVLGIKNGANIGWMLSGTDDRVKCFCALFGAGWRAYNGLFKNSGKDLEVDDERFRFLAGAEAHAYAQYVQCPVMYLTATNSPNFDSDRAVDTLLRLQNVECYVNYAPRLRDALDSACMRDVELFFEKHLLNGKIVFLDEPKLTLNVEGQNLIADFNMNYSDTRRTKSVTVYFSEGEENPAYRDWNTMNEVKNKADNQKSFVGIMNGNSNFVNAFALIELKNGVTICSKIVSKKIPLVKVRYNKLIYSASEKQSAFSVFSVKKHALAGLFFCDDNYLTETDGANEIKGISSKYGLVSYKVNERFANITDHSFVVMDVYCNDYAELKLIFMLVEDNGVASEYYTKIGVKGSKLWQNIMIKCTDFKTDAHFSIKDYSKVAALRIEAETKCIINNIILI